MSSNGLFCNNDVNRFGMPDSSYFLKKGEQLVIPSPLQIISPDETEVVTLSATNSGVLELETFTGGIDFRSSQAGTAGFLGVSPFSGIVTLANPNTGADGRIALQCSQATSSEVEVTVRPTGGASAGIKIQNVDAPLENCTLRASSAGNLQLSATNNIIQVIANGGPAEGLQVKPIDEVNGIGSIAVLNGSDSVTPTRFTVFNSSLDGGGLNKGNLQIFGYTGVGLVTSKEVLQATPEGDAIILGDPGVIGGAEVSVNGPAGFGQVFDTVYNRPGIELLTTFTTDFASSTSPTFTVPFDGATYMLEVVYDYGGATVASPGQVAGFLKFGDPANAATVVTGTQSSATDKMVEAFVGGFNVLAQQRFFTLSTNVFEANQRYTMSNFGSAGMSGGIITMNIYLCA